jgi:hypothetical protein
MGLDMWIEMEESGRTIEIGYWRKANQVHKWFVDNIQDGIDECQRVKISKDKLSELKNICIKILNNHTLAKKLLPTTSGYFFGSTEYDYLYFQSIEHTISILNKIENMSDKSHIFFYQSSW